MTPSSFKQAIGLEFLASQIFKVLSYEVVRKRPLGKDLIHFMPLS